ncbi:MAG: SUMF1/EgtB/PvdO family nonheme iron enzyme [Pseudomonadota bacterium]
MATVFISHASLNDALVNQLKDWMIANGVKDVFVDHEGIVGGAKWRDALRRSVDTCRVVVCVVTEAWLASPQCYGEFDAASVMGKRILPLRLMGEPDADPAAQKTWREVFIGDRGVDLRPIAAGPAIDFKLSEATADELRRKLREAGAMTGLDPEAFKIDKAKRPFPFPGLSSFEDDDADAALFYGRSSEIAQIVERLRAGGVAGDRSPLTIVGSSGSGKSSLLKAGVIPRLRRETGWAPLRPFRPGDDPLLSFAEAVTRTLSDQGVSEAPDEIRQSLMTAWRSASSEPFEERWRQLAAPLDQLGARICEAYLRPNATLLLSVDQAEELARATGESADALCDYLRASLVRSAADWRLVIAVRSDGLPELLRDPRFEGLNKDCFSVTSPRRFDVVIEGPAQRYGVKIEAALVEELMKDAADRDTLPLLAFVLERLWRHFSYDQRITLENYNNLGSMSGMIEDAAERALCGLSPREIKLQPKIPPRASSLAEAAFVPALAQINDQGEAIRRSASWSEFTADERNLLNQFIEWRLLTRQDDKVEVAHEALLREWTRLTSWLMHERERLEAFRGVELASAAWKLDGRAADRLTHFGERLSAAQGLTRLQRYNARLSPTDREYLSACERSERQATRRRRALQRTAVLLGAFVMAGSLSYAFQEELSREYTRFTQFAPFVQSGADIAALNALAAFRDCADPALCPEMVVLPSGVFAMGSKHGGADRERPTRDVAIPRVAVGRFEVTHDQWRACVKATARDLVTQEEVDAGQASATYGCAVIGDFGFGRGDRPAIGISWHDAKGYIAWLNYMIAADPDGGPYRLLSEAEWEYAARGGAETAFSWGKNADDICSYANVVSIDAAEKYPGIQWDPVDCPVNFVETSPVGRHKANPFGLHDVHGNVWEWVEDCWHDSYSGAPPNEAAWMHSEDGDCSLAVQRGGSWYNQPWSLRSANRRNAKRSQRNFSVGFRIARTL